VSGLSACSALWPSSKARWCSFWGLANDITPVKEAKRIYALLSIGANLLVIIAKHFANILKVISMDEPLSNPWELSLKCLHIFVVAASLAILSLHGYVWSKVVRAQRSLPLVAVQSFCMIGVTIESVNMITGVRPLGKLFGPCALRVMTCYDL